MPDLFWIVSSYITIAIGAAILWMIYRRKLHMARMDSVSRRISSDQPHGITIVYDDGTEEEGKIAFLHATGNGTRVYSLTNLGKPGSAPIAIEVDHWPPGTGLFMEDSIFPMIVNGTVR